MSHAAKPVLIAALSGRALAVCARRAGYAPLVADLFGDQDMAAAAQAFVRVHGSLSRGFSARALHAALYRLAHDSAAPLGLVYGSGFEDRPNLLAALAARHTLLGNSPAVVARCKDPRVLAALCASLGVPHPELGTNSERHGWLDKRIGGSGGTHIQPADSGLGRRANNYRQRIAPGCPVSALFLADGRNCRVLGFSEQWANPARGAPFRYGGAVRPAGCTIPEAGMARAVAALTEALGLVGLNSADFLVTGERYSMLEINPRPGASLDVSPVPELFRLHLDACAGYLTNAAVVLSGADAAQVVYAPHPIRLPPNFGWPAWTADRQPGLRTVAAGAPFCTVLASAAEPAEARALVDARSRHMLAQAGQHRARQHAA